MDPTKTVFGDLRRKAAEVIRVQTESSVYFVAFHEERGRKYVVVRGAEGSDRENVVVRDSDPRIGDRSLFEVPITDWIGQVMEVAMMRTSPIVAATHEDAPPTAMDFARPQAKIAGPPGLGEAPRVMVGLGKGTNAGNPMPAPVRDPNAPAIPVAQQVVVGQGQQVPYPVRHVMYAEDVATYLRSIHRRDQLWNDISHDPQLTARLVRALEDSQDLLKLILRRRK